MIQVDSDTFVGVTHFEKHYSFRSQKSSIFDDPWKRSPYDSKLLERLPRNFLSRHGDDMLEWDTYAPFYADDFIHSMQFKDEIITLNLHSTTIF